MAFFPQISSGCIAQWPLERQMEDSNLSETTAGGNLWLYRRGDAATVRWQLWFEDLTTEELAKLETFFGGTRGGLNEFVFFDPLANLLAESEALNDEEWTRGVGITCSESGQDAGRGKAWRVVNSGGAAGEIAQSIPAEAGYKFCFSTEVRGSAGSLELFCGGNSVNVHVPAVWTRLSLTGAAIGPVTRVGIRLSPGANFELREPQAEAQAGPSPYKVSQQNRGIYQATRFESDNLQIKATAFQRFGAIVRLISSLPR